MTILCPHMILLSAPQSLSLYAIPDFTPVAENAVSSAVPATLLAKYNEGVLDFSGRFLRESLCSHHEGRLSTLTFSTNYKCRLVVLPPRGRSSDPFVEHTV